MLLVAVLAGCLPPPTVAGDGIQLAVRETLSAIPSATPVTPAPPLPTGTEVPLAGIFCEYEFCIGHPKDLAFYDVVAKQNPNSPTASTYDSGILAANNTSLFIEVIWQDSAPGSGAQFLLSLILDSRVDVTSGASETLRVRELQADYVPVQSNATAALPYGAAATWSCGNRAFAWKAYTDRSDVARPLLEEALNVFRCSATP